MMKNQIYWEILKIKSAKKMDKLEYEDSPKSETTPQQVDRLKQLYPNVNEDETPLPRNWSPIEKCNSIYVHNFRVHYKGTWSIYYQRFSATTAIFASLRYETQAKTCAKIMRNAIRERLKNCSVVKMKEKIAILYVCCKCVNILLCDWYLSADENIQNKNIFYRNLHI